MCSRLPSALLQRVHVSVSVTLTRFVYEGSAGPGWWPYLNRERWTLSFRERAISSSLLKGGVFQVWYSAAFWYASVCEVAVDVCSERGILGCGRKGVVEG